MYNIGINVEFFPYDSLKIKPPFHGRYWIAPNGKGYIVDGSLNTYGKGKIFAQLMDKENYDIIKTIYDNNIIPNQCGKGIDYNKYMYICREIGILN